MTFSGLIPKPRIESLSDLIFGLALSIGSLSLLSRPPVNPGDVVSGVIGFGFSFFILISVWLRYTAMVTALPRDGLGTKTLMSLNILLLFFVAIEPYLLSVISFGPATANHVLLEYASQAYALDLMGLTAILALFAHMLVKEEGLFKPDSVPVYRVTRNTQVVGAACFGLSLLPIFWSWTIQGTPLRFYLWYGILGLFWITDLSIMIPDIARGLEHYHRKKSKEGVNA